MCGGKKLYIFDLDGTLADVYRAIHKSLNYTRKKFHLSAVTFAVVKRNVGAGDKNFIAGFFKAQLAPAALAVYRQRHKKDILRCSRLMPGAKALLRRLRAAGKITALATNRPGFYTRQITKALGLDDYLDFIVCADEIDSLKPAPKILNVIVKRFKAKKAETVFVGDMDIDLETARRAKISAVFVKGGSTPVSAARRYKGVKIISSLKEL